MIKKVLTVVLLLLLLIIFLMYQQEVTNFFFKVIGQEPHKPIKSVAKIFDFKKNVTVKRSQETTWNSSSQNEMLALLDSVSTGYDSTALISFNIGYNINLGERSLIVIENPQEQSANLLELNIDQGTLQATTTNAVTNDVTLKIKSDKTVTEVKGQSDFTISINKETKQAEIWIRLGEAKVTDDKGNQIIIKQNERRTFAIDKIETPLPIPVVVEAPPVAPVEAAKAEPIKEVIKPKSVKPKRQMRRLRANEIAKEISKQRKKIDTCYERKKGTSGGQRITVKVAIQNTGVVSKVNIASSTLQDAAVERCVLFWVKAIRFPKFDGDAIEEKVNFVFQ